VSDNLEQATRIGMQGKTRWRVVTLQGQLVDTSGTMSGGGHHVAKGGMRASACAYSPEEVKVLVQAYEQAQSKLVVIRQEHRALEEALQLTEREIAEFNLRERKCTMELASLKKQMASYEARLKVLVVPKMSSDEKSKVKQLEKLIASRSGELQQTQEQHKKLEDEVRQLHHRIMNIGGDELNTAKAQVKDINQRVENMRRQIKKAWLDADTMEKNSKRAQASAKHAREERENTERVLETLKEEHAALDDKAEVVLTAHNELKQSLAHHDKLLNELKGKRDQIIHAAQAMKSQEVDLVNEMEEKTRFLRELYGKIQAWANQLKEARAEYQQLPLDLLHDLRAAQEQADDLTVGSAQQLGRTAIKEDLGDYDLRNVHRAEVDARITTLEETVKDLKPNLTSIEEFRRADAEYRTKQSDYDEVNNRREEARRKLEALRQDRLAEFMSGFSVISVKLKEMYQLITLGGDAELELVDTLDPFSEGINFSVRPPKKSWKQITNLSGGEKTLASLSLVFALHHYKPTPLYFMDEIDAALDFRNVSIIAGYIKERTKNAQFIVISLRNHMFESADLLVGIYKTHDVSKSLAINPKAFEVKKPLPLPSPQTRDAMTSGEQQSRKRTPLPIEGPPNTRPRVAGPGPGT